MHTTIIAVALVTFTISIINNCESVAISLPKTHRFNNTMKFGEHDVVSTLQYNDTATILESNHSITTRLKQQGMQHKIKKKKGRFFEQFFVLINEFI
ncbi:serine proteinase stubble-like isoform X2 [Aphis craccivora]|uniref:Serine proteinase stubble-like isoform X2 n=1 Tax=Aphis craccivora TaxID=307492 RepID=A0A6G0Z459_APHCR|nr:serine proteinase stubble-like isoform X2 [Aphis craccivora]